MKRFEAKKVTGIKFKHPQGYTLGEAWGVYDNQKGMFVADKGKNHPWDYNRKSTALDIATQFNEIGVFGELSYGKRLNKKAS